jgi:hypothetical protein
MKMAARDADCEVDDAYSWNGSGIVGGFTVAFSGSSGTRHIPVLQYKNKAAADADAKKEMKIGYNYPVQNGIFLTFTSANKGNVKDEEEKTFLENLINGKPLK